MYQDIFYLTLCGLTALSTAAPAARRSTNNNVNDEFENIDNFPNPNAQQLLSTDQRAHGTLTNSTPPASVSSDTVISLQLIAAQEQFEAAFFNQLLANVTNAEPGFQFNNTDAQTLAIDSLTAIVAVSVIATINSCEIY
jgi:hypothetical protein